MDSEILPFRSCQPTAHRGQERLPTWANLSWRMEAPPHSFPINLWPFQLCDPGEMPNLSELSETGMATLSCLNAGTRTNSFGGPTSLLG